MKISQVAAQMYTVRQFAKTSADCAQALRKIRAIGYQAVQLSGVGVTDPKELAAMVRGEGLVCCATHEPGDKILNEPQACVDRLNTLGCTITAYPYPSGVSFDTYESIKAFCAKLNAAGKVFRDAGMQLCYHNHQIEFRKVNGRIVLDIIYAETDPACLLGEIDTYWVQTGGGDCVEWCRKLKNRQPIIHLKDYGIDKESKPFMAEIGNGNLDFKAITAVAEAGGCKWYSVEQDVCPADPFDSLKQSFEYIRQNLVS